MKTNSRNLATVLSRWSRLFSVVLAVALMVPTAAESQFNNPAPVPLLTAGTYGALSYAAMTGTANVEGDIGSSNSTVNAGITPTGTNWTTVDNNHNLLAQLDLGKALDTAALNRPLDSTLAASALGGLLLQRGVYAGTALDLASGQTLTLSGSAADVFIIKSSSTLTINTGSTISLTGGAVWSNVFWIVGSDATINGGSSAFNGIILAVTSISLNSGATMSGRLLAHGGAVTINSAVLPVELVAFTATANRMNAVLHWSTATELDNDGFEIERRQTGNWANVGFVPGEGTSSWPRDYSYTDNNLSPGKYVYRIKQIDRDGSFKYFGYGEVEIAVPTKCVLEPNFPNPFNPSTHFSFSLPWNALVSLTVFDALGREVSAVISEELPAGQYSRQWNAADLPSGVYFYRLVVNATSLGQTDSYTATRKLLLLR